MNTIFRVAKTELRILFYSPIAWFLMIVFLIQCGMSYVGLLNNTAKVQELGGIGALYLNNITARIFLGRSGLFGYVMQNLYLYIPLLTMSLISRETGSGTIKLLYSSPIKVREIVLGKYLAMMVYCLILVAIVSIFIISGLFHIQHVETGMLMTSILGFYLLLCAYAAIGLFMSTLSTYQVISAICTFIMIGILSYIGELWQRIAFVRELTYFLSINGRAQKMLMGMVTTKDIVYFIVIVYIFLGFSIYKLKDGMESKAWGIKAMRYVAVLASALLIGYISSIPAFIGYYDATFNKTNTLTPRLQRIMKDMKGEPLEVTGYANLVDGKYYVAGPDTYNENLGRWEAYMRFKENINIKTVCYYDSALSNPYLFKTYPGKNLKQIADQFAKMYDMELSSYLTPQEIHKVIDLRPESNRYVMQLKWKGEKAWLRVFDDMQVWPSETEVAVVLKRLQKAKLPKVAFVTGDLERDIYKMSSRDYTMLTNLPTFRYSLVNQGFDVQSVSLDSQEIPADIAVLVLADPKLDLSANAKSKLAQYISKGGNLLIAGEPGRQTIINPLLSALGVQMTSGLLVQETKNDSPSAVMQEITPFAGTFYKPLGGAVKNNTRVSTPGAAGLTWSDSSAFTIRPLLKTLPKISWNRMKPFDPEMMVSARVDTTDVPKKDIIARPVNGRDPRKLGIITFSPADGDVKGPITTAVSLVRNINNKEQRIIVSGDADLIGNAELSNTSTANFYFSTGIFCWLGGGEYPIDTSRPEAQDKKLNVSIKQIAVLKIIYVWVLPAILVLCGSILLIRRKRK